MENILIVDGMNLLFQMFYGMPNKIVNSKGETIHGTIGFIGALFKMIRMVEPEYIAVIFDGETPTERTELDENYKGNRAIDWNLLPEDEVPFNELDKIKSVLNHIHIYNIETDHMEADDLISSITFQFQKDYNIFISSFDSDFFQLINENVQIIRYRGKNTVIFDQNLFVNKFDFYPKQYVFYKSLVGDKSDNIKGLSKIGHKRATQLVKNYPHYEEILKHIDIIEPKCIRDSLMNQYDRFKTNLELISLSKNSPTNYDINDFLYERSYLNESSSILLRKVGVFD